MIILIRGVLEERRAFCYNEKKPTRREGITTLANDAKKNPQKRIGRAISLLSVVLLLFATLFLSSCGEERKYYDSFENLYGTKVATITGTIFAGIAEEHLPDSQPQYFSSVADEVAALKSGQVSAIILDEPVGRNLVNLQPGLKLLDGFIVDDSYGFAVNKAGGGPHLRALLDEKIAEYKENGTLKEIDARWFGKDDEAKVVPDLPLPATNGTITFCTDSSSAAPFDYIKNGEVVGYDIELMTRICNELGYGLEIKDVKFDALIIEIENDKSGMTIAGASMSITEERKKKVDFTAPIYSGGVTAVVLSEDGASGSFFERVQDSFYNTLIKEKRYMMIFEGLGVTVLITLVAAVLGTALAAGVCALRRSSHPWLNIPARIYIKLIQGVPVVVFLMILAYVVFAQSPLNRIVVAIIGFAVNFSAYVAEMMRTSLDTVSKGELEAASAMGFSKLGAFKNVTLPHAARGFLPVFKGEFVSMMKMTSVVGYIAVVDLTRVSDIIRGSTYESFFPLALIAVIYFALSLGLTALLSLIEFRLDPAHKKRRVKGVTSEESVGDVKESRARTGKKKS